MSQHYNLVLFYEYLIRQTVNRPLNCCVKTVVASYMTSRIMLFSNFLELDYNNCMAPLDCEVSRSPCTEGIISNTSLFMASQKSAFITNL